jgi:hypothetical protein
MPPFSERPEFIARDFAVQSEEEEVSLLEEYRRCVMKTTAYEKKTREFLTQLLSTSNDDQRDYLAAHIMDFQRSVFGFNTRLHYASRGEQVAACQRDPILSRYTSLQLRTS